ncbi:hypothetical protein FACS1894164_16720 [Spirochaetia bacterium]|nr:hypothetical protein FACS1894164_16720 [Spirochaetia bacterium]
MRVQFNVENAAGTFGAQTRIAAIYAPQSGGTLNPIISPDDVINAGGVTFDNTWAWWKPIKQFNIVLGKLDHGYAGMWGTDAESVLLSTGYGGDGASIFTGFGRTGALIEISPIDMLTIGVHLGGDTAFWTGDNTGTVAPLHAALKFALPDLFNVRVGFVGTPDRIDITTPTTVGDWNGFVSSSTRLEAAFALTAVPGLTVEVGGKYVIVTPKDGAAGSAGGTAFDNITLPIEVAAGIDFKAAGFALRAHVNTFLGGKLNSNDDLALRLGAALNAEYDLGILKAGALFGLQYTGEQKVGTATLDAKTLWSATPYVGKNFAGGSVYAGFQFAIVEEDKLPTPSTDKVNNFQFSVPIGLTYSF